MSNPFESRVAEEGTGDPDLWFNLAPALLLGGLLPMGVSMLSACVGLSILTWPITLLLTLAGSALGGASIHHRRGGAMSGRDLVRGATSPQGLALVGLGGIGKSRLARHALTVLDGAR